MKILVIGSGGREHALVWKIAQSKKVKEIFCAPGNPGITKIAQNINIAVNDLDNLLEFALKNKIDLTLVGPEVPLVAGIVDLFEEHHLPIIGPIKNAALIEGSKVFAKKLMLKYKIPTAQFAVFDDYFYAEQFLSTQKYPLVIKADGLCAGKGVSVCKDESSAQLFLRQLMVDKIFGSAGKMVVIEECLYGQEVSFTIATDGKNFVSLLPSQDHKKIFDGDLGSNTGGMGAYAPVPLVSQKLIKRIEDEIVKPTIKAMAQEGCPYKGILYPGVILTKEGPKTLEYNCRFGDPETQPILSLLKSDIIDLFLAIQNNSIKNIKLRWKKGYAVCVTLASKGYPGDYKKGKIIRVPNKLKNNMNIYIFHAGTKIENDDTITNGGRVIGITGIGKTLKKAIKNTYKHIGKKGVYFSGMHYRKDIGMKGLKGALWK